MRVGYFADGPWSHVALEKIVACGEFKIAFIVPRYDTQDPVLKRWAEKLKIPYLICNNVNSKKFIAEIARYGAEIFISMSFNQILKKEIINLPPRGFINCHAGALPFYRGRCPLNWVLINGEKTFGITVHEIDEGIDTGDIIEQRHYAIKIKDNYSSLLNVATEQCAEVLLAALIKVKGGSFIKIKQHEIHPVGSYYGMRTSGDEVIDFQWTSERVINFIRGVSSPAPGAIFLYGNVKYSIEKAGFIRDAPKYIGTAGEVIGRNEQGIVVKTGDSSVLLAKIKKLQSESEDPYEVPRFRIGSRLNDLIGR